jgi:hypothetical protein
MAISFDTSYGDTRITDLGTALSGGTLELQTSGDIEVATLTLANPVFSSVTGKVGTFGDMGADSDATGGDVAKFVMKSSSGTDIYSGTVTITGGGGDIEMPNLTVPAGSTVDMNNTSPITFTEP